MAISREVEAIIADSSHAKNIYTSGSAWWELIDGMKASVNNRPLNQLPLAKVNKDDSVSLLLHHCSDTSCPYCPSARTFENALKDPELIEQLEYHRERLGIPLTEGADSLVTSIEHGSVDMVEYRINISPEHLDTLLKLSPAYGYRGEASILKLRNNMTLKPDTICLFPVSPVGEHWAIRTAGCQTSEIPTVQLLHLLPGFDGIERYFHWEPKEVNEHLGVDRGTIESIYNQLFKEQKMLSEDDRKFYLQEQEGSHLLASPTDSGDLRIVDMTTEARQIYLTYGNIGVDEIDECKSVEISTSDFLKRIKTFLEKQKDDKYYATNPEAQAKFAYNILVVDEMIRRAAVDHTADAPLPLEVVSATSETSATPAAAATTTSIATASSIASASSTASPASAARSEAAASAGAGMKESITAMKTTLHELRAGDSEEVDPAVERTKAGL